MEFSVKSSHPEKIRTDCIVSGVYADYKPSALTQALSELSQGAVQQFIKKSYFNGKLASTRLINFASHTNHAERILLIGLGKEESCKENSYRELISKIYTAIYESDAKEAVLPLAEINVKNKDIAWKIHQTVQVITNLTYRFDEFKSQKPKQNHSFKELIFLVSNKKELLIAQTALEEAKAICEAINFAKNLANMPANYCTPTYLAEQAKKMAKEFSKISTAILEEKEMRALKMGLLLSVTQGSASSAKLITLEYRGHNKNSKPIVLVGKGITFDTGGNSIKIPPHQVGMKYDMCGAATVFAVLKAAASLALPLNIIGIVPACENMPGPTATRPEDIVTSMSGYTVEILNTDAEGRLILADALTYSERFQPEAVIDIATLTGGCMLALGPYASGLMGNDEALIQDLKEAGNASGDKAWELPLWEEYFDALKSEFADFSNVPLNDIGARTIVAGCFLAKFTQKFAWAHLDIANTATIAGGPKRGATGRPIPLLMHYLLTRCK